MPNIKIIFSDDTLLVVDKSANLVVTPADTTTEETLSEIVQKKFAITLDRGGLVHRLDKDTSGLIIFAKTQKALEFLQSQFKQRLVKKEYLALVHGFVKTEILVKGLIERNPRSREKFIVSEEGRESETKFIPLKYYQMSDKLQNQLLGVLNKNQKRKLNRSQYGKFTLVRALPLTGRTHQIRVHLKYINHPIVGDEKYAGRKVSRLDHRFCARQFLHAAKIVFYHPQDGRKIELESKLPEDLESVLALLEVNKNEQHLSTTSAGP